MSARQVLQRITDALDRAHIAYMITGSLASAYHGVPRATQDIDMVVEATAAQLRTLVQLLPSDKYYVDLDAALEALRKQSMFNIVDMATGWKIDLIIRKSRAYSETEFGRRKQANLEGIALFVASLEDVVISKLEWAKLAQSQRQIADAAGILRIKSHLLDRSYLEKWIAELGLVDQWSEAKLAAETRA